MSTQAKPDSNEVWASSGTVIDPGTAKVELGWLQEKGEFEYWNYILNLLAEFVQHVNLNGIPVWDATTEYEANALVIGSNGLEYIGLTATNQANDPTSSPADWRENVGLIVSEVTKLATVDANADVTGSNPPQGHAASHQHSGTDEVATATPANNAIPKANGSGKLAVGWFPGSALSTHDAVVETISVVGPAAGTYTQVGATLTMPGTGFCIISGRNTTSGGAASDHAVEYRKNGGSWVNIFTIAFDTDNHGNVKITGLVSTDTIEVQITGTQVALVRTDFVYSAVSYHT